MGMLSRLEALHRWLSGHIALTLVVAGATLVGGLVLSRTVAVEQDIGAMLPDGPGSPREAARLLEEFGLLNVLLIDLEVPGASPTGLAQTGNALAERLRASGAFSEVYTGPTTEELLAVGRVLFPRRLYLLSDPRATIEQRLVPAKLEMTMASLKARLALPQAMATKADMLGDPLDLNDELLSRLSGMASVQTQSGQLLSRDQSHVLLITVPRQGALDTHASRALLTLVAEEATRLPHGPAGPARIRAVGGPRFAAESAASAQRDVLVTVLTSLVALCAIFLARFRSLRLLVIASVPLAFGVLGGVTAVVLVHGRIQALTFAFGSVLIGIALDYPIYLLNSASAQTGAALERMSLGLKESWRSLWLGLSTTMIAFALMLLSRFPGLRELALFAGSGIAIAFACTIVLVVPIGARWGMQRLSSIPSWMLSLGAIKHRPRLARAVVGGLVVFAAFALPKLRFDGELRHLDAQRPATLAEYDEVRKRFGLQGVESVVVARGASAEDALRLGDQVTTILLGQQERGAISHVVSLGVFLPSVDAQVSRRNRLATLDETSARATLTRVSAKVGFSDGAFEPFWNEVQSVGTGKISPVVPEDLVQTSLQPLVKRLLQCSKSGCIVVSSFEPTSALAAPDIEGRLPAGSILIDGGVMAAASVAAIPRQLALLSGVGLLLNLVLLGFAYRAMSLALLAWLPGALGLLGTLATLALVDVPLNLVSASALVLILGCGVDYGIFAVQGLTRRAGNSGIEFTGILLTSSTALAGFGTLALASYAAIRSLGVAVGLGIVISAMVALFLVPSLFSRAQRSEARHE